MGVAARADPCNQAVNLVWYWS